MEAERACGPIVIFSGGLPLTRMEEVEGTANESAKPVTREKTSGSYEQKTEKKMCSGIQRKKII